MYIVLERGALATSCGCEVQQRTDAGRLVTSDTDGGGRCLHQCPQLELGAVSYQQQLGEIYFIVQSAWKPNEQQMFKKLAVLLMSFMTNRTNDIKKLQRMQFDLSNSVQHAVVGSL